MYFYDLNEIPNEAVSYSTAAGQLVAGEYLKVSLLRFKAQGGAEEHAHSYEQIMVVVRGKLRVRVGEETGEIGPGQAFLAPSNVQHQVTALEDTEVISCKDIN
jgi:quercetin dioxygenase-like cupin family protein